MISRTPVQDPVSLGAGFLSAHYQALPSAKTPGRTVIGELTTRKAMVMSCTVATAITS